MIVAAQKNLDDAGHPRSSGDPDDATAPIRILHVSDLHVRADADPTALFEPLRADLMDPHEGMSLDRLDYLVITGDISNRATPAEFEKALAFVALIIRHFNVPPERCIVMPGNHDLDWSESVYDVKKRRDVDVNTLTPGSFVKQGELFEIRNDGRYPNRFKNFSECFYQPLLGRPYPLPPEQQCISVLDPGTGVQFITANSAWEIDDSFKDRSGLHYGGLMRGLKEADAQVQRAKDEGALARGAAVLRIAAWHHPVTGNDKIKEDAFLENLQRADVRVCLHGHVHEERAHLLYHLHPTRRVHVVGAGSFGAPTADRPESTPQLYNVIELQRDLRGMRVYTRCKRKKEGAWEDWYGWPGDRPRQKLPYYDIVFHPEANPPEKPPEPLAPGKTADERRVDWTAGVSSVLSELNRHFAGHAQILGIALDEPNLCPIGELSVSNEIKAQAKKLRSKLVTNDRHGILADEPDWTAQGIMIPYEVTDFATITALRAAGQKPRILSASGVIVTPNERTLLLHMRGKDSATYPNLIHTLGGAFIPEVARSVGDATLRAALLREIMEESKNWLTRDNWPAVLVAETTTGFVQYVALGLVVTNADLGSTWEGKTISIPFDALEHELLKARTWVPSGKLHILLWLAAGAPGCTNARFGSKDAATLLRSVLDRSATDYPLPRLNK